MSYFKCELNKPALSYKCGETIRFNVFARQKCKNIACQYVRWELRGDDGKSSKGLGSCEEDKPLVIETTLDRPGFVHLVCRAYNANNGLVPDFDQLDAGAGAEIEKIEYSDQIPEDFDEYWNDIEKMVADFPVEVLESVEIPAKSGYKAYDVKIKSPEGRNASGVVTVPDKEGKFPIKVRFEAYGLFNVQALYTENMITGYFNAHGIENDKSLIELFEKYGAELEGYGFNNKENSSNMTTYFRAMIIRDLIALKYLKTLDKWDGKTIMAVGGSQGAMQATTVAAHDKDVTYLEIFIPWFCNLCAINDGYIRGWRPDPAEGLRYFDTAAQGTRLKCPVRISARLGDYVCPPSSVMAFYNGIKTRKSLDFMQAGTHGYEPHEKEYFKVTHNPCNSQKGLVKGIYRHFKGNEYEVLDVGYDSETTEEVVIYKALYGDKKIWVRPKVDFCDFVFRDGEVKERFELLK